MNDEYRSLTRKILREYRAATPREVEDGEQWYPLAYTHCERIAAGTPYSVRQAVIALAHLSPRVSWSQNLLHLKILLSGQPRESFILTRSWDLAKGSLEVPESLGMNTFSSRALKTRAFAQAILGDNNAVVVDTWATRVAGAPEGSVRSRAGYVAVADAYRRAAKHVEHSPAQVQAITWCRARGTSR